MYYSTVAALDCAAMLLQHLFILHVLLNLALLVANVDELVRYLILDKFSGDLMLHNIL